MGGVVLLLRLHAGAPPAVSALGACTAASPASSPSVHHRSQQGEKRCSRLPMWQVTKSPAQASRIEWGWSKDPQNPLLQVNACTAPHSMAQHGTIDHGSGRGRLTDHSHRNPRFEWPKPPTQSGPGHWLLRRAASGRSSASAALRNQLSRRWFQWCGVRCCTL